MSFVTVFTASAMGFVLLAPILMVAVLVATQGARRVGSASADAPAPVTPFAPAAETAPEPAMALSRAA